MEQFGRSSYSTLNLIVIRFIVQWINIWSLMNTMKLGVREVDQIYLSGELQADLMHLPGK